MIKTNYTKSDWKIFISNKIIRAIPILLVINVSTFIYLPFFEMWLDWMDFIADDEFLVRYIKHVGISNDYTFGFVIISLLGSGLFLLIILIYLCLLFPSNSIIRKLKLEPQTKLIIFFRGKPVFTI